MPILLNNRIHKCVIAFSLLSCLLSSQLFAGGADGEIKNSQDIMTENVLSTAPAKVIVLKGNEKIKTPFDDLIEEIPYVPIEKIMEPIVFKKGLFITEYNKLLREKLIGEYPKAFKSKTINEFFFKALAQRTYSHDGYLAPDFFNAVVNGRTIYFRVSHFINNAKFDPLIKIALMYLYLQETVYLRNIKDPHIAMETLSKIPVYPVLYMINPPEFLKNAETELIDRGRLKNKVDYSKAEDQFGNPVFGNYINFEMGENLFYICANYYPAFINLPPEEQLKILDIIKSFNSTLTSARPIRADNTLISYLREQFHDIKRDRFLKYRLKSNETWLLLPQSIDSHKNQNSKVNND
jgi:hypothetical protein